MCCVDPDEVIAKTPERVQLERRLDAHHEFILLQ
jgi:hypothetical protein